MGKYLPGSALSAWKLLDLMGELRSFSTKSLLLALCDKLVSKLDTLKEKELIELLAVTYPYIGFSELRPVVLQIMKKCQQIPLQLLQSLHEQLPALQIQVPVQVMQQLWKFNEKDFIEAISPLVKLYIIQSAASWSVRTAQHLQRTKLDEVEQITMRSSHMIPMTGDTTISSFSHDSISVSDLDIRKAYLSISSIVISNPSEETLRMMKTESESIGNEKSVFGHLFDPSHSESTLIAEIVTPTAAKLESQLKLGTPINSYSAFGRREINIPLQLLSDYIGEHVTLYTSAIQYVRRLMSEIQAYQLKPRSILDFDRQFPLLNALGILHLFTVFQSSSSLDNPSSSPIGLDPSLKQILGSLRFDLLMAQHDRTHTSICENDGLYRFAWCMDAIRREKTVEERHFEEMEEIFTLLNTQLAPLKKVASTSSSKSFVNANSIDEDEEQELTKPLLAKSSATGKRTSYAASASKQIHLKEEKSKRTRPKRTAAKTHVEPVSEESFPSIEPLSRSARAAAARNTIKQAVGRMDEDSIDDTDDDDDDEVVLSRTRAKQLKRNKPTKKSLGVIDTLSDDDDGKPQKKKKKTKQEDDKNWSDGSDEDKYEDAGMRMDEGDDYVDLSEESVSDESVADDGEADFGSDEDYDEFAESQPRRRAKRTKTTQTKAIVAKMTKVTKETTGGGGGVSLKVTLAGLTGTGALASQSAQQKGTSNMATSIVKLKRGNQVLVDTAATLSNFSGSNDSKTSSALYAVVSSNELESQLNLVAECGWIVSTGSMQMTIQSVLFTILKEVTHKLSKLPSVTNCNPSQDLETVKKFIISDKRISRLTTLLRLGFSNFPILTADGLDHPSLVGLLAEKIVGSKILPHLLSGTLSTISTKPWTKKNVDPQKLNDIDRTINLLSAISILTVYLNRYDARNANKGSIKSEANEDAMENESKRLESILSMSKRHEMASGDLMPNIKRTLMIALHGLDEMDGGEGDEPELNLVSHFHPDSAFSMVLFWVLTQIGSANEIIASSLSQWTTSNDAFWKSNGFWQLLAYPTFIQELLFGFAKLPSSSPVLSLRHTMVEEMLMNTTASNSLLSSTFGTLQLLSYLYLALSHGSISKSDAHSMMNVIQSKLEKIKSSSFDHLISTFNAAISHMLSEDSSTHEEYI
jgi:hypothetical protein